MCRNYGNPVTREISDDTFLRVQSVEFMGDGRADITKIKLC